MTWNENNGASINERIAETFYGEKMREEELKKRTRDGLLHRLGGALSPVQVLYSSIDELKKMEEKRKKKFEGVSTGYASPIGDDEIEINGVKLKGKIPVEQKIEKSVSAKLAPDDWDKQEIPINNVVETKNQDNGVFSLEDRKRAREFIQGSEGFRDGAYLDEAGVWTIGYGHTGQVNGKPIAEGMKITKDEAEEIYRQDFEKHIAPLKDIKTPLTRNQQIALASLIYNVGPNGFKKSKMYNKIQAGDIEGAASEFDDWIKSGGKISQGLINRRKREKELFLKPDGE